MKNSLMKHGFKLLACVLMIFIIGCNTKSEEITVSEENSSKDSLKAGNIEISEEGNQETQGDRNTVKDLETGNVESIPKLASEVGLVPNDEQNRDANAMLLAKAINVYGYVIIDNVYYIGNTDIEIRNESITIIGKNNAELIFQIDEELAFISLKGLNKLEIRDVKIENLSKKDKLILVSDINDLSSAKVENVIINECVFIGDIIIYAQHDRENLNPNKTEFGIDMFEFSNNEVIKSGLTSLILTDIPFKEVVIRDNYVRNFRVSFALLAISNNHTYAKELKNYRKLVRIINNSAINDDDCWNSDKQIYYVFALTESDKVIFDSNHVEGLKSIYEVALYDAYLSSNDVKYTNNTWINNICFYEMKSFNTLIKAKTGENATRIYDHNEFIVEESFAQRLNQPKELLFVHFIDINSEMESFIITNNIIDVYEIKFPESSRIFRKLVINDNVIKAQFASGVLCKMRIIDAFQSSLEFNNNNISITQRSLISTRYQDKFNLIQFIDSRTTEISGILESITIKNNRIIAPINYILYGPLADDVIIENNRVEVVDELFGGIYYDDSNWEIKGLNVIIN